MPGGAAAAAAALLAGLALLTWIYWPVIVTGLAGFAVVRVALRGMPRPRRRRRLAGPAWVAALAAWRAAGRIGR